MKNKIIEFIKKWFPDTSPKVSSTGVIFNDQSLENVVPFGEIVKVKQLPIWEELNTKDLPEWKVYNQLNQFSCVAHARCLIASIMFFFKTNKWVDFSRAFIYRLRKGYPEGGMEAGNSFDLTSTKGLLFDEILPSDGLSEEEMNNVKIEPYMYDIADGIQANQRIGIPTGNIDTIASIMQATNKPIILFFKFNVNEWMSVPQILSDKTREAHAVVFVPHSNPKIKTFGIYKGKKAIIIQDSAMLKTSMKGYRVITEDFFKKRNYYADYFMNFKFEKQTGQRPSYDGTILSLQDCLKWEGVFPVNISSTGYPGPVTKQAIMDFQKKYGLEQVGFVGPKTEQKLKEIYK